MHVYVNMCINAPLYIQMNKHVYVWVARRHSVAGLNEIGIYICVYCICIYTYICMYVCINISHMYKKFAEMKLSEAAKSLSTFHGVELKKSLVALRKSAMSHTTGHQKRGRNLCLYVYIYRRTYQYICKIRHTTRHQKRNRGVYLHVYE
jgi:hypothetical protein